MKDDNSIPSPPILGYANIPVQGSAEWWRALKDMMDANASPKEIRRYFRTDLEALTYYCHAMRLRFSDEQAQGACILCRREPAPKLALLVWRVRVPYRPFELTLGRSPTLPFPTWHAICDACAKDCTWRIGWRRRVLAMFVGSIIAAMGFFVLWIGIRHGSRRVPVWLEVGFVASLGALVITILLRAWPPHWPRHLYTLMPEGVELRYIRGVYSREKRDEQPAAE